METRIIYDTYINSENTNTRDKNYGSSTDLFIRGDSNDYYSNYTLISADINLDSLKNLKIKLYTKNHSTRLNEVYAVGAQRPIYPTNLTVNVDLYSIEEVFEERKVTWNTSPKVELLANNIISFPSNNVPNYFEIDLLPFVEKIGKGFMLKLSHSTVEEFRQKYNTNTSIYPWYELDECYLELFSSESNNPPILYFDYGAKPPQPKVTSPIWGNIINKKTTSSIRFDWDSAGQTLFVLEYSQDGQDWTAANGTTAKYYNLSTNGLDNGNLYVRVKIKANNIWSDYSQTWFLQIGEKPNTPIINLTGAATSTPRINWNANSLQYMYQVQVLQGTTLIEDSGELKGDTTSYNLKTRLESGQSYTFKTRISDKYGIWSDWATNTSIISFARPPKPTIILYPQIDRGSILIDIENPIPDTGEEATTYNEVFRKENSGSWIRIATNVNERFIDYTVKSETIYLYKVRAIGENGYNDSETKTTEVKIRYSDLAIVGGWDKYVKLKYNDNKKQNAGYSGEILKFAGRDKPVVEFEDTYDNGIALYFELTNKEDLDMLQNIIDSRKTLLYRDSRGRKIYGNVISKLDIEDLNFEHYGISFTFTEVDYSEVV